MRTSLISLFVLFTSTGLAASALGQSGRYFLTDETGLNQVWQFQGGALVNNFATMPAGPRMGPILVDGNTNTIRYVEGGLISGGSGPGWEHQFNGTPVTGPLSFQLPAGAGRAIDGAFDGQFAYTVTGLLNQSAIYRYNADWSGPGTLLFNLPSHYLSQGITYDVSTNTIWTSDYAGPIGRVRQWSLAGVELFSFPIIDNGGVGSARNTALAYDPSDDTFWLNAHVVNTMGFGFGELWQFSRNGTFLQKIHGAQTGGPQGILYWGGEIYIVPAPGAAMCAALAGGFMLRRRRV